MKELIIIGDRVLIDPEEGEKQTRSGLYLPASVAEKERVGSGRVMKVGPGHVIPNPDYSEGEVWSEQRDAVRYLPLQARAGDFAFFLRKDTVDLMYEDRKYIIIPHHAILALVRSHPEDVIDGLGDLDDLFNS